MNFSLTRKRHDAGESFAKGVIKSMGLVFGDIGTSPIYTLTVIFLFTKPTHENVFGILSLIIWTLIIVVTAGYAWLVMSLGHRGEGGTIVLKEILLRFLKPGRTAAFMAFLTHVGVSLLLGEGVITPAISILSAVEGMVLVPGFEDFSHKSLLAMAVVITVGLFIFQYKGTDKVAKAFGPIMVVWFAALAISGLLSIKETPGVLSAVNPYYAVKFFADNGFAGFLILSEVVLCATGVEALYADMGHLGRKPITRAWYFVFFALAFNYLGQGAFIMGHPEAENILFGMVKWEAPLLYVPFLALTICATVIASQALISGVFSIAYQAINTGIIPLMKVHYTSLHIKSQIYIGFMNWFLMLLVIFIMLVFGESSKLAAAYGLAVTGTMTVTGTAASIIFFNRARWFKFLMAALLACVNFSFLASCLHKLPHGAYWSLILASMPFAAIMIWTKGQRALYTALMPLDLETFLVSYKQIYEKGKNIPGTAVFFVKDWHIAPRYVIHCIIASNIIYERNVFISILRTNEPFGIDTELKEGVSSGLDVIVIKVGYMEALDIEKIIKDNGIIEKVIFYGIEEIATTNIIWRVFSVIKKLTPNFVQFYNLPVSKLRGVVTRVDM
jgi:KUP system potassium uptake protein